MSVAVLSVFFATSRIPTHMVRHSFFAFLLDSAFSFICEKLNEVRMEGCSGGWGEGVAVPSEI